MNSSTPKAVVFDLGKVLLDFDYGIAIARLVPRVRLSPAELHALLNQSPLLLHYEAGALSTEEFFARVQAASGYRGDLAEFGATFADIFREIQPMTALHAELRQRGVPTYIFSNTNELAITHIRRQFPFFRQFDGYVLSYQEQALKPAPAIYAAVEAMTGRRGADLLYLDDRPENVATAHERGWRTVLHEHPAPSRAAVAAAGLLEGTEPA